MRLMIDTNIFIDVMGKREPFYQVSKEVLALCETGKVEGFVSASSVTDIYYILHKLLHDKDSAYRALGKVLEIVKVLTVTNDDVLSAYLIKAADFEDCLLATCAKANKCDAIVTRNIKDFSGFGIRVISPEEVLQIYDGL